MQMKSCCFVFVVSSIIFTELFMPPICSVWNSEVTKVTSPVSTKPIFCIRKINGIS